MTELLPTTLRSTPNHELEEEDEKPFHIGDHYLYKGFWYFNKFPVEWAKTHLPCTGPQNCDDCAMYGTVHEGTIFVGYCTECAVDKYLLQRGDGFSAVDSPKGAIPPLLCDVSPPPSPPCCGEEQQQSSILQCHFEGGYNDY